jgi:hypothetical protein
MNEHDSVLNVIHSKGNMVQLDPKKGTAEKKVWEPLVYSNQLSLIPTCYNTILN